MTKFFDIKVGDPVWLMHGNKAVCAVVTQVRYTKFISSVDYESIIESEAYKVSLNGKPLYETYRREDLFLTKADLIKSL